MKKTVCELFAGVGGFRCGLNHISEAGNYPKKEKWETVWFSQWEPSEKTTQYAHDCYVYHFGECKDLKGELTTNLDIEQVVKADIPDFNLLVGGFPCQDYSVASTLKSSKGIDGKKGVLWWSIRDILEEKKPAFVLLENVDRLLKSPASQRGRDFGIILGCFRDEGYTVEWRVINAADYGFQQRRRRIFIFAYKSDTKIAKRMEKLASSYKGLNSIIDDKGFFARSFPVQKESDRNIDIMQLPEAVGEISNSFKFLFENYGIMVNGTIYSTKTVPSYDGRSITLGDIMEQGDVDKKYFIDENRLYYTDPNEIHSDEMEGRLPQEKRNTWQYLKGAKRFLRTASNGHVYTYSEGPIPMIDSADKPARTMLTSEGSFNRSTHIVIDKKTGKIRLLTPEETERIQGFPTNHTKLCLLKDGTVVEMPLNKRRFMMGNALVVNLISQMEPVLDKIFKCEK